MWKEMCPLKTFEQKNKKQVLLKTKFKARKIIITIMQGGCQLQERRDWHGAALTAKGPGALNQVVILLCQPIACWGYQNSLEHRTVSSTVSRKWGSNPWHIKPCDRNKHQSWSQVLRPDKADSWSVFTQVQLPDAQTSKTIGSLTKKVIQRCTTQRGNQGTQQSSHNKSTKKLAKGVW